MRGLIYKNICLFFKSIEKRQSIIIGILIVLLFLKAGIYAGLMTSITLGMVIGIQNILSFGNDEKAEWRKYQKTMPVSDYKVVASKYISIIYILLPGILASIIFNLLSNVIYGYWTMSLFGLSIAATVIIPLVWSAISLPLTYLFGFHTAQAVGFVFIFPIVYIVNFFEDGPGLNALPDTTNAYLFILFVICAFLFILSYFLSVVGYSRKR